jgi:hypothetical protein
VERKSRGLLVVSVGLDRISPLVRLTFIRIIKPVRVQAIARNVCESGPIFLIQYKSRAINCLSAKEMVEKVFVAFWVLVIDFVVLREVNLSR